MFIGDGAVMGGGVGVGAAGMFGTATSAASAAAAGEWPPPLSPGKCTRGVYILVF